jgi:integrase
MNEYLFISKKTNDKMTLRALNYALSKMSKEVGLSDHHRSSHMMRKTFAFQKYVAHKDDPYVLSTIQSVLNHSSERTTLKYLGIDNEVKRDLYLNDQL